MAATFPEVKVQAAILDYRLDWSAWLGTDTISSAVWAVTNATAGTTANTTTTTTVRISGGTAGVVANAKCTITTAAGFVEVRSIDLSVVASLEATQVIKAPGATMAIPAPTWSDLGGDTIVSYAWTAAS